jgi:hypothetical protein
MALEVYFWPYGKNRRKKNGEDIKGIAKCSK